MATKSISIETPSSFWLKTVVRSHGWYDLPPFEWNPETNALRAVVYVGRSPATLTITQPKPTALHVEATIRGAWSVSKSEELLDKVRLMFGLNLNFDEFYSLDRKRYGWAKDIGAGPFLRCGSAFEDAVKMLATTNCSWSLTRLMVQRLVDEGPKAPGSARAFPTSEMLAEKDDEYFRTTIRTGYRAQAFREFATLVAQGTIDPQQWSLPPNGEDDSAMLIRQITKQRGFGRYAAENLCKLWGRFGHLGIDSWCLKKYDELFGPISGNIEKHIREAYAPFGRWQGLALWLDLTKDWHST